MTEVDKIAFLAPDETMYATAQATLREKHGDIRIEQGLLSEGVEVARDLVTGQGVDIIITRGGTASAIRESGIKATIVDVPITGFDVIRSVEQAKAYGRHIGVVAFPPMIMGIDCLGPILGVDISLFTITSEFEAEAKVLEAFNNGADVVLGGVITGKFARRHNRPYVMIRTGAEGILQAAEEAKRIASARRLEKVKTSQFRTVLDYAHEGIVSVDSDCRITILNPVAAKITRIDGGKAIGKHIAQVWPDLRLEKVVSSGREDLRQFVTIRGRQYLCSKVPIVVNGLTVGAIATFQDIGQIQQLEAQIRQRIYAAGHVAGFTFDDIICESPAIRHTIHYARRFAATESAILILGETGTGKEVFAQSIHNYSQRSKGPFVAINCAALPGQILESELFGYVGGAFTGANKAGKTGLFEVAHGGTIFLDEVAEIDYTTQGKLLRVLQEKKVMRLGGDRVIPVDVRVIAATNKNLKSLVLENKFRDDLYYRLNVLRLNIPPLRDRPADIPAYARLFLEKYSARMGRKLVLTPPALDCLTNYSWPGNIRELQSVIERIVAVCLEEKADSGLVAQMLNDSHDSQPVPAVVYNELEEIKTALAKTKGRYAEAAKLLGISRSTLWRKLRQAGLK